MIRQAGKIALCVTFALVSQFTSTGAVFAAQDDLDLLQSYVGDWRGRGDVRLASSGTDETVLCKMAFQRSGPAKIGMTGRCSLAGATLAMRGTVAYVEQSNRYEAVMSSSTSFKGVAIGVRRSGNLEFRLNDVRSEDNASFDISVGLELADETINVRFEIVHRESGAKSWATIPFRKR